MYVLQEFPMMRMRSELDAMGQRLASTVSLVESFQAELDDLKKTVEILKRIAYNTEMIEAS